MITKLVRDCGAQLWVYEATFVGSPRSMAEVIAGVAAASAFLSLISFASDLLKRLSALEAQLKHLPSTLTRLAANIALLRDTLTKCQSTLTRDRIPTDTETAITGVIKSCAEQLRTVHTILQQSTASADDSRWRKGRKALKLAINDKKIDEAERAIRDHVQALAFYQTTSMMANAAVINKSDNPADLYSLPFTLQGVPVASHFIARKGEIERLEQLLRRSDVASPSQVDGGRP